MLRCDGGEHRRVDGAESLADGEYEGRATRRLDTCIVGIAELKANAVDALAFLPKGYASAGASEFCFTIESRIAG